MVRKKKLSPSGARDADGDHNNAHLNLHKDELVVPGLNIGEEVFVMVREGKIVIQPADVDTVDYNL